MDLGGGVEIVLYCRVYSLCVYDLVFIDCGVIYVCWLFGGVVVGQCSDCKFFCWCDGIDFVLGYGFCFGNFLWVIIWSEVVLYVGNLYVMCDVCFVVGECVNCSDEVEYEFFVFILGLRF